MSRPFFEIPSYHDYLSPAFAEHLLSKGRPVNGVPGLLEVGQGGGLETTEALLFLTSLYSDIKADLARVLAQRIADRKFIDERMRSCAQLNKDLNIDLHDPDYKTVIGLEDAKGRVVIGPLRENYNGPGGAPVAPLPEFLKGPHVTLFGPPDSAKMAINAMNSYHRKRPDEPAIVEELLRSSEADPMWGADDEDSKTPLRADLVDAAINLTACLEGTLSFEEGSKKYALAADHLALPIKRFPGLALPTSFLFFERSPIPLHLYDFALHLHRNWDNPRALVFYVPKLENEDEARYIHTLVAAAEKRIKKAHPSYVEGSVRLMIVLENPRAILRAHEIMDALHPYFAGASLGWHDYLASTARLFKEDGNYRIPVKADPEIVIKHIRASHLLLANTVGSRGGIRVGGMYGILPTADDRRSLGVALKGFVKDVITQFKRGLTGFWVAHPDFVRLGLALVEGWRLHEQGNEAPLVELVKSLLNEKDHADILHLIRGPDRAGLDEILPGDVRSLIVADIKESDFIANNHPEEIRYNVFQSLQYLTDWLSGNGCVALPTVVDGVPVRVMDDLATAERSRWEVWHELKHGRFSVEDFLKIAHEEMNFIRRDLSNENKIVQVKWDSRTEKWYPIAFRIMLQLMLADEPAEFATELLLPFTADDIRAAADPWIALQAVDPGKYRLPAYASKFDHYFEICGNVRFAKTMASLPLEDLAVARDVIFGFSLDDVKTAAAFHGDIGQSRGTLDSRAAVEQARVLEDDAETRQELRDLGALYRDRFGFKFLISAKGKSAPEIRDELRRRLTLSESEELQNARAALWEISDKRLKGSARNLRERIDQLRRHHGVVGVSIAINDRGQTQSFACGESLKGRRNAEPDHEFELASLSKTIGSAFALEYFREKKIPLTATVNSLFAGAGSAFRLTSPRNSAWADRVTLEHLMNHTALNMHYVRGFPLGEPLPPVADLLDGRHGYDKVEVISEPGTQFQYSGAGFLVLEHLLETLGKKPIAEMMRPFLERMGLSGLRFDQNAKQPAHGYFDSGDEVRGTRYQFPPLAAGGLGTATEMARFLSGLARAFADVDGVPGLSHDTAVTMLHGTDKGSRDFMGCDMGLGVFTAEAGRNRLAIHQGANEGFRALFIQCYEGPDAGKGLVIFCNGDNRAVAFIAEAARLLLEETISEGLDFSKGAVRFQFQGLAQEQIVNLGYKTLLFEAFEPDLPEHIVKKGPRDPLADLNLAVGGKIVSVTNQKFARAENLLSDREPVFDPELFGRQGKIMDSWESARHSPRGSDTLVFELRRPSEIRYASLSTKFHDGNQAEFIQLFALAEDGQWHELLPKTPMTGHSSLQKTLAGPPRVYSRIRVVMFPDGGFTRLGLYKDRPPNFVETEKPVRFTDEIPKTKKPLTLSFDGKPARSPSGQADWANAANGGRILSASNEHYGPAAQVISPYPPIHMFDGLESARSRERGHHEDVVIAFAKPIRIESVSMDFKFFVNNNPLFVSIEGLLGTDWIELIGKTNVKAFAGNQKVFRLEEQRFFRQIRVKTYPDGGINRIKVWGSDSPV